MLKTGVEEGILLQSTPVRDERGALSCWFRSDKKTQSSIIKNIKAAGCLKSSTDLEGNQ